MCVHVHLLPEDCLLPIFDRVPLLDLLRLDRVCPRWAKLLPSACARRRILVLILGGGQVDDMQFHIPFNDHLEISFFDGRQPFYDLPVVERDASLTLSFLLPSPNTRSLSVISFDDFLSQDDDYAESDDVHGFFDILYEFDFTQSARFCRARLDGHLVTYFRDLFANVQTLVVIHPQCTEGELHTMVQLVRSPSWSLKTLKLWIRTRDIDQGYVDRPNHHPICTLLESINRQQTSTLGLRQLTLDIDGDRLNATFPIESYFNRIEELKLLKLYLGWYARASSIWAIVSRLDSAKLRHIELGELNICQTDHNILNTVLVDLKFEFTTKVSQLYWNWKFETVGQFGEFCWQFPALTALQMAWSPDITFTRLVANLALLEQLTHLELYVNFKQHPESTFTLVDRVDGGEEARIISLPQIKTLKLNIEKRSHRDFVSLSPLVFPSVEVIILQDLVSNPCNKCQPTSYIINWQSKDISERARRCHRLLVLSVKNKFANNSAVVRLYARHARDEHPFVDWSNYVQTDDEALL